MKHLSITLVVTVSFLASSIVPAYAQLQGDLPPSGSLPQSSCVNLSTNLGFGTTSGDVTTLQNYLVVTGYMTTEATGYFGNITMNAVSSYQSAHNISPTGYVGPLTRAAIQSESCGTSGTTASTTVVSGNVVCPARYSCTPKVTAPPVCPLGYNCTPNTTSNATLPTYVPGSWYNSVIGSNNNSITGSLTSATTNVGTTQTVQNTNTISTSTSVNSAIFDSTNYVNPDIDNGTSSIPGVSSFPNPISVTVSKVNVMNVPFADPASTVYSVSVDYSKSIDSLLTSIGIPAVNRDDDFNLGLLNTAGSGQKNLDLVIVDAGQLIPSCATSCSTSIGAIYNAMHAKSYRPATLQEFLTVAKKYPQLLNASVVQDFGSLIQLPSPTLKYISAGVYRGYKYFIPTVTPGKITLSGFQTVVYSSNITVAYDWKTYGNWDSLNIGQHTGGSYGGKWLVVDDPTATVSAPIAINALPSQSALTSGDHIMFTGEKYPVHVDYSAPYPTGVQVEAQDIPTDFGGSNFSTPKTGSADINIELVMIRGANQSAMDDPVKIRDEIASSPSFSGYRFATAAELVALMETYKDQFNDIMAFGSINIGCGYYPWLWKKSSVMPGSVSGIMGRPVGSGPTNYSDMRRLGECMPTGENANGSSFYSSADLSSCTTNLRLWDWKFALVKI